MMQPKASGSKRFATLNIWGGFYQADKRIDMLRNLDLDLDYIALQEVVYSKQVSQLQEVLQMPFCFAAEGKEGPLLLSREEMFEEEIHPLGENRFCLRARAKNITLACAHTSWREQEREEQAAEVLGKRAHLLGADFNNTPEQIMPLAQKRGWRNCAGMEITWPSNGKMLQAGWRERMGQDIHFPLEAKKLDYIFSQNITYLRGGALDLARAGLSLSDHLLLWSDFLPDSAVDLRASDEDARRRPA